MPIDASIYFQQQAPDILGGVQKGMTIRDMMDQRQQRQDELAKQQGVSDAYAQGIVQNPDGSTSFNSGKTLAALAGVKGAGQQAFLAQQQFQQQDAAAQKAKMDKALNDIQIQGQLLGASKDQASYDKSLQDAAKYGIDVSQLPKSFDPGFVQNMLMRTVAAKDQIENQMKQLELNRNLSKDKFEQADKSEQRKQEWAKIGIEKNKANSEDKNLPQNVYQAATFAKRVEDANNQMNALIANGYDPSSYTQALKNKYVPEALKGSEQKQMEQAQRNFVNAVLRRESGSAISDSEFQSARQQYFPQVNDDAEQLAQKQRNREVVLAGLRTEGAKAMKGLDQNLNQIDQKKTSTAAPKSGHKEDGYVFKGGDASDPKNWEKI